jgi:hypothetical protein
VEYSLSNIFNPVTKLKPPYLLTYSMEQSPSSEPNWFSVSQEIPHIIKNPKVHYCIHTCLPPVPILSQLDPAHAPTPHFLKIHLNIILWVFQMASCPPVSPQNPYKTTGKIIVPYI